jgi:hypothetical protein
MFMKVLISVIMQGAIAVLGWVLLNLIEYLLCPVMWQVQKFLYLVTQAPGPVHKSSDYLGLSSRMPAFARFLEDFQDAQCFFVLAVQVALFYATSQSVDFQSSDSMASLYANDVALKMLSVTGKMPVFLTQACLFRAHLDSVYSLLLSTTAYILASTASFRVVDATVRISPNDAYAKFNGYNVIDQCGGNSSPWTFCISPDILGLLKLDLDSYIYTLLLSLQSFCLLLLWIGKLASLSETEYYPDMLDIFRSPFLGRKLRGSRHTVQQALVMSFRWFLFLTELWTAGSICLNMESQIAFISLGGNVDPAWSIGQVIAVVVWAPVLVKFLYFIFRKFLLNYNIPVSLQHVFLS